MDITIRFNEKTVLNITTDKMSPRGVDDYMAEQAKADVTTQKREALRAEAGTLKGLSKSDQEVLQALLDTPSECSDFTHAQMRMMRNQDAVRIARALVAVNTQEAPVRRMMAIIARDEYYDVKVKEAKARMDRKAAEKKEIELQMQTDPETAQERLNEYKGYFRTNDVQLSLAALKVFDRGFLPVFNGNMLEITDRLKTAETILSGKAMVLARLAGMQNKAVISGVSAPKSVAA